MIFSGPSQCADSQQGRKRLWSLPLSLRYTQTPAAMPIPSYRPPIAAVSGNLSTDDLPNALLVAILAAVR